MANRTSPTGRIAPIREPNIQNIPVRTPEGEAIRDAFTRRQKPSDWWDNGQPRTGKDGCECQDGWED